MNQVFSPIFDLVFSLVLPKKYQNNLITVDKAGVSHIPKYIRFTS